MPRPPSPWNLHVKKVWDQNKHKVGYKFKQALKDAAKTWKNGASSSKTKRNNVSMEHTDDVENEAEPMVMKKGKKSVRKTLKTRKVKK